MSIPSLLQHRRPEILSLAARHGAKNVRLFGSVARGEDSPESDIDFLVDMEPGRSLLDIAALKLDLEDLLKRSVDIVTATSIHWLLRRRILREARAL